MTKKILIVGWLMACLTVSAVSAAGFVLIPWGEGDGKLAEELTGGSNEQIYKGPSAIRVGPEGDLYILDTLGYAVERFTTAGKFVRSYRYPSFNEHDAEIQCIDFVVGKRGDVYLLETADRVVLHIGPDGKGLRRIPIPFKKGIVIPSGIAMDGQGNLVVLNGFDNALIRFDDDGAQLSVFSNDAASAMVNDGTGGFLGLRCPSRESFRTFWLMRVDAATEKSVRVAVIEEDDEISFIQPLGTDGEGNYYVEVALGTIERPHTRKVVAFDGKGKEIRSFRVPDAPNSLTMVRSRALGPDGTVWCARTTRKGFVLQPFPLAKTP